MRESGCAVVRQGRLIALVRTFLIGCAFLLIVIGCSGTRSEAPQEEGHGRTEATKKEQTRQPEATASEEARCEGTRTFQMVGTFTTNDLPGCPKGGLLLGTDKADKLDGKKGDDEIRGLGAADFIYGGVGNDVIYAGPGDEASLFGDEGDDVIYGGHGDDGIEEGKGADVIFGGDGNDEIFAFTDDQRDKLYCGKGKDAYHAAEKIDYVSSSCEKKIIPFKAP
jgi:RTX calcium-binding nonapeptide repeat (4 copies)